MAADHQVDRILPAGTAQALLRHEPEAVTGGAGVEGLVAPGAGGEVFWAFVTRGEGLGGCGRYQSDE